MTPAEIIREARSLLFERGWTKHALENRDGECCVLGALNLAQCGNALGREYLADGTREAVATAIDPAAEFVSVSKWNNAAERTFPEVIDMLDRAEKIAERRAS